MIILAHSTAETTCAGVTATSGRSKFVTKLGDEQILQSPVIVQFKNSPSSQNAEVQGMKT
jgi:hypothetical protein